MTSDIDLLLKVINLAVLIIVLTLVLRSLLKPKKEYFNSIDIKYRSDIGTEHMEFVLSNVKLGEYKYLTVIHHRPFNFNGKMFHPLGQLSIVTEDVKPQQSEYIQEAIKNNQSAHLCASYQVFPLDYTEIWNTSHMLEPIPDVFSIWRPIVPDGYVALADIIVRGRQKPANNLITCVPVDDTVALSSINQIQWSDNKFSCHSVGRQYSVCSKEGSNELPIIDLKNSIPGISIDDEQVIYVSGGTS